MEILPKYYKYKRKEDDNLITQIKKRDGEIVNYDSSKIVDAISRAAFEVGENILDKSMERIVADVESGIEDNEEITTVECIQDMVEEALINTGHVTTARAYKIGRAHV